MLPAAHLAFIEPMQCELVVGGYVPAGKTFDALLVGYYDGRRLIFIAKIRNGFVPSVKREVQDRMRALETDVCPFANLPEPENARRDIALTQEVMKRCRRASTPALSCLLYNSSRERRHQALPGGRHVISSSAHIGYGCRLVVALVRLRSRRRNSRRLLFGRQ